MTRTDDILNQINAALDDDAIGPDAMRCGPEPPKETAITTTPGAATASLWISTGADGEWQPVEGVTNVEITTVEGPDWAPTAMIVRPAADYDSGHWAARGILARRLIERHGYDPDAAVDAVLAVERGDDSEHTALARAEARAVMREAMAPIAEALRAMLEALRPAMENATRAMSALARAVDDAHHSSADDYALAPPPPGRPRDRPAWQSPYGPPTHRHR